MLAATLFYDLTLLFGFPVPAENKREPCNSHGSPIKAEPMDLDPPGLTPPASSCLLPSDEPLTGLPTSPLCPQKVLFSQDISVKMASELLYKLSGRR